jgi:hypothetical protein
MSIEIKNTAFAEIDLDEVDLEKLTPEQYARLLRAKGIVGKGDYTKERRKWVDSLDSEEIKKEVQRTAKLRKEERSKEG